MYDVVYRRCMCVLRMSLAAPEWLGEHERRVLVRHRVASQCLIRGNTVLYFPQAPDARFAPKSSHAPDPTPVLGCPGPAPSLHLPLCHWPSDASMLEPGPDSNHTTTSLVAWSRSGDSSPAAAEFCTGRASRCKWHARCRGGNLEGPGRPRERGCGAHSVQVLHALGTTNVCACGVVLATRPGPAAHGRWPLLFFGCVLGGGLLPCPHTLQAPQSRPGAAHRYLPGTVPFCTARPSARPPLSRYNRFQFSQILHAKTVSALVSGH